jgi:hypothetical protein
VKILCAIAVVADLALAALLVALSGFIFGGGPGGQARRGRRCYRLVGRLHRRVGSAHSGHFAVASRAAGIGVFIAWAPVIVTLLFASIS